MSHRAKMTTFPRTMLQRDPKGGKERNILQKIYIGKGKRLILLFVDFSKSGWYEREAKSRVKEKKPPKAAIKNIHKHIKTVHRWILVVQKTADLSQGNRWHRFERGLLAEFAADGGCVPPDLQPTLPAQSKKSPWRIDGFKFLVWNVEDPPPIKICKRSAFFFSGASNSRKLAKLQTFATCFHVLYDFEE